MNGGAYLYQRRINTADLPGLLAPFAEHLNYLYVETPGSIELTAYNADKTVSVCDHGRAFGPTVEIRWDRATDDTLECLLISEEQQNLVDWTSVNEDLTTEHRTVLLWGTHTSYLEFPHISLQDTAGGWLETRIPRLLNYPIDGTPRNVRANVVVYYRQARPVLTRLADLVEYEGEANAPRW